MVTEWWACASVGETVPMIAGPNVTRSALNRRARALLKAEARLDGPVIVAHDREYCVGEWVVTKRNRRDLRSADGHFVKNGRAGVVTALDPTRRPLTLDRKGDEEGQRVSVRVISGGAP